MALHIYAGYDKRLGAYKVQYILKRDYGMDIGVGRVYRLVGSMDLPKMPTAKPKPSCRRTDNGECSDHLQQRFSQDAPNPVRVSDITYLKAGGKWHYPCVAIGLFSRKAISWHLPPPKSRYQPCHNSLSKGLCVQKFALWPDVPL